MRTACWSWLPVFWEKSVDPAAYFPFLSHSARDAEWEPVEKNLARGSPSAASQPAKEPKIFDDRNGLVWATIGRHTPNKNSATSWMNMQFGDHRGPVFLECPTECRFKPKNAGDIGSADISIKCRPRYPHDYRTRTAKATDQEILKQFVSFQENAPSVINHMRF
jgi:hypothetical protein